MKLIELTEYLVKNIVKNPDDVSVKAFDDEEEIMTIQVLVSSEDIGAVIGKDGVTANAIRTLVQTASYISNEKKIKINIDSF